MAGHASNWFKVGSGSAKGKMFISNATLKATLGNAYGGDISLIKKDLVTSLKEGDNPYTLEMAVAMANESMQPGGVAKSKPKPNTQAEDELTAMANQIDFLKGSKVVHDPATDTYAIVQADGTGSGVKASYAESKKALETLQQWQEQDKAKAAASASKAFKNETITVTQSNGKKVEKSAITQGGLAVVETPYGHAVVHKASGKALLYIDGDKQQVYSTYKKKYVTQAAPSATSKDAAKAAMEALNNSSTSWDRPEAESLSPNAQAAIKTAAGEKGVKATDIAFKPAGSKGSDPGMPEPTTAVAAPTPTPAPAAAPGGPKSFTLKESNGYSVVFVNNYGNTPSVYQVTNADGQVIAVYKSQGAATKKMNALAAQNVSTPKTPKQTVDTPDAPAASVATVAAPTAAGYQHTFSSNTRAGQVKPLGAAAVGDSVEVPYLKTLKNHVDTAGVGSVRSINGNVAVVKANGLYHAVDTTTGVPLSVHHATPEGAMAAAAKKQRLLGPKTPVVSKLPAPELTQIQVGKTSGTIKDVTVQAEVYGPLAINLDTNGSGYTVSHVETGYQMAKHFTTKQDAMDAVEKGLESGVDWGKFKSVNQLKSDYNALASLKPSYSSSGYSPQSLNPLAVPTGTSVPINSVFKGQKVHDWGFETGSLDSNIPASGAFEKLYKPFVRALNGGKETWWTASEKSALVKYQGDSWYGKLNHALWSSSSALADSTIRGIVKNLDLVTAKSGSPIDITATKAQSTGSELWHQMAELNEGADWSPLGFDSTKVASPQNSWGGGGVRVHYQVPGGVAGTGVHYNSLPNTQHSSEVEFLISRNTRWKVAKKTVSPDGGIEVVMAFAGFRGVTPGEWTQNYPVYNP